MNIDFLVATQFMNFRIDMPRGQKRSGGGMSVLVNAIQSCLNERYRINLIDDTSAINAPLCLTETCFFVSNIIEKDYLGGLERRLEEFEARKKEMNFKSVLICAEMSLIRMLPKHREKLLNSIDALYVTDPYLMDLLSAINLIPNGYLCDCIDPDLFYPREKEMLVTAVGGLKHIKNIDWILEVFQQLKGKVETLYMGSSQLWSHEQRDEDMELIPKIKEVADTYIANGSSVDVAYHDGRAAFAVNDTWHDCSSRANEELLMSGVISVHGQHPLFRNRPGFTVRTPDEAVEVIRALTEDYTTLPDPKYGNESREWALKNVSKSKFVEQFENVMRYFL